MYNRKYQELFETYCQTHPNLRVCELNATDPTFAQMMLAKYDSIQSWTTFYTMPNQLENEDLTKFLETGNSSHPKRFYYLLTDNLFYEPATTLYDIVLIYETPGNLNDIVAYFKLCPCLMYKPTEIQISDDFFTKQGYQIQSQTKEGGFFLTKSLAYNQMNRMTIMVIGSMEWDQDGAGYARALESLGHNIIRVSIDKLPKDQLMPAECYLTEIYDDASLTKMINQEGRIEIQTIIEKFHQTPIDWIWLIQTEFLYDTRKLTIPYLYYQTKITSPQLPLGVLPKGVFFSYYGGKDALAVHYKPEFPNIQFIELLPPAADPNVFKEDANKRTYKIGFKGQLDWDQTKPHPIYNGFYSKRRFYTMYARDYHPFVEIQPKGDKTNPKRLEAYQDFLQKCDCGLNIPGDWGDLNRKMFQIPLSGGVLLQYYFPELGSFGFSNKVNCLVFRSERELSFHINWAMSHPEDLELIRHNGKLLVEKEHTYLIRSKELLLKIDSILTTIRDNQRYLNEHTARRSDEKR